MKLAQKARDTSSEQQEETMKILIEEAEKLHKQIDKAQVHLINARLQSDEEGEKSAISEMETAMCNTMQLLTCLIERKDNIVDLSEVWHNIEEEAKEGWIIGQNKYDEYDIFVGELETILPKTWFYMNNIGRWAYIKDLLPKGGEQWNTTK